MPSLTEALDTISQQSAAIYTLSSHNVKPAGKYTTAYLDAIRLNPESSSSRRSNYGILDLVRDPQPAEERLFKFIGEDDGNKKAERRDGIVTPLREHRAREKQGDGAGDAEVLLRTALTLVNDYHDMPRARAAIKSLIASNNEQLERIFELELAIEDAASNPAPKAPMAPAKTSIADVPSTYTRKVPADADEAFKFEEAALRALEAKLAPARARRQASAAAAPPTSSNSLQISPPIRTAQPVHSTPPKSPSNPLSRSTRTPAANALPVKTPAKTPNRVNVTNSLVSQTPRTSKPAFDRFSPLKLLGTPRHAGRSGLRQVVNRDELANSTGAQRYGGAIFGARPSKVVESDLFGTPAPPVAAVEAAVDADETVRFAPSTEQTTAPVHSGPNGGLQQAEAPAEEPAGSSMSKSVTASADEPGKVDGIWVENPLLIPAVAKMWATSGHILKEGSRPDQELDTSVPSTIQRIITISRSDPDNLTINDAASTTSSYNPNIKPVPITETGILTCHVYLTLLRAIGKPGDGGDLESFGLPLSALKDRLSDICRVRGWAADDAGATKKASSAVLSMTAKKAVKIDYRQRSKTFLNA